MANTTCARKAWDCSWAPTNAIGDASAEEGTPLDFGQELLPDDLDRISENVERAFKQIPVLAEAGIKRVINGPMIWSPELAALFGPVPELQNYFCCNGIIPGFSQSGGLGVLLAQWIVEGEPELDLFAWDLARYGKWASKRFTKERALDCYAHRFKIHFPYEERDAGRPVRTRLAYERQKAKGAVFGLSFGWGAPAVVRPAGGGTSRCLWFRAPALVPAGRRGMHSAATWRGHHRHRELRKV